MAESMADFGVCLGRHGTEIPPKSGNRIATMPPKAPPPHREGGHHSSAAIFIHPSDLEFCLSKQVSEPPGTEPWPFNQSFAQFMGWIFAKNFGFSAHVCGVGFQPLGAGEGGCAGRGDANDFFVFY